MRFEKERLEKTVNALIDKAEDCFELAKSQHKAADLQHVLADKQHENADKLDTGADKLDTVGDALTADAMELKGSLEMDARRTSPRLRMLIEGTLPEPAPIAIPK
jgi:hypothetical protein